MGLREVSAILWKERHLLEVLLFKLEEEQLLLAAGRTRWLPRATHEIDMVLEELGRTEMERAKAVAGLAGELGLSSEPSLSRLTEAAPPPWPVMLAEHRQALLTLSRDVTGVASDNAGVLAGRLAAALDRLDAALLRTRHTSRHLELVETDRRRPDADTWGAPMAVDLQLEEVACRAALGLCVRTLPPSLSDFLR
jgi:hypothetical protein